MLKNRNVKNSSKVTFPQLMTQIQRMEKNKRDTYKQGEKSQNKTFHV